MNRRQMLKKAAGIGVGAGVGAAVLPAIVQAKGAGLGYNDGNPVGPPSTGTYQEPPLDTRTPEQVWDDQTNTWAEWLIKDAGASRTKYHKEAVRDVGSDIFARIQIMLQEQHKPIDLRTIAGRECLVINGNVIARRM